jgi:hypothetical protein
MGRKLPYKARDRSPSLEQMGSCIETNFVPSGNVLRDNQSEVLDISAMLKG